LARFGEQILLSVRFGAWSEVSDPEQAANWARFWRAEIQGYLHAYRAVTGVDLTLEPVNATVPSVLLRNRLAQQRLGRQEGWPALGAVPQWLSKIQSTSGRPRGEYQ